MGAHCRRPATPCPLHVCNLKRRAASVVELCVDFLHLHVLPICRVHCMTAPPYLQ
jgi:hypothetical protein